MTRNIFYGGWVWAEEAGGSARIFCPHPLFQINNVMSNEVRHLF
jgi:hypothetical protein